MKEIFIKTFSEYKYAKSFIESGSMFFRSAQQFATMEGDSRQDIKEGQETFMINTKFIDSNGNPTIRIHHSNNELKQKIEEKFREATKYAHKNFSISSNQKKKLVFDKINDSLIYSITYLNLENDFSDLDISKFGDHMVIIMDTDRFKKRISEYFHNCNLEISCGEISYYSDETYRIRTLMRKHEKYKGEHEYRFIVYDTRKETSLYDIGNIDDISTYINSNQLTKFINDLKSKLPI